MRDIDFLRDDEGAPIEYVAERHGYELSEPTWTLPPLSLSRSEIFAFSVARKVLERFEGTPFGGELSSLLAKIGKSLQGNVSVDIESLTDAFTVVAEDRVEQKMRQGLGLVVDGANRRNDDLRSIR